MRLPSMRRLTISAADEVLGQFGAGLEVRLARHIGWTNDLSFGVIDGPRNNFGMVPQRPELRLLVDDRCKTGVLAQGFQNYLQG